MAPKKEERSKTIIRRIIAVACVLFLVASGFLGLAVRNILTPAGAAAEETVTKDDVWLSQGASVLPEWGVVCGIRTQPVSMDDFHAKTSETPIVFLTDLKDTTCCGSDWGSTLKIVYLDINQDPPIQAEVVVAKAKGYQYIGRRTLDRGTSGKDTGTITVELAADYSSGGKRVEVILGLVFGGIFALAGIRALAVLIIYLRATGPKSEIDVG
ncbi:MAG: hypothetical protein A2172_02200 [Candidatus Woykebacteria bacterium RBG_13_40_15]|uniref:Uncharacterized protein n=1 Tax=Candidatus Woykebacteria bacterium RBG_13_40_15 TaxID=1802593 RepID=A0A1G1W684_9BACT|nr:MAG: hypothetical protein A2172_02200 [Candidatus Woykebacteria bacterium RBG_13_40_15]